MDKEQLLKYPHDVYCIKTFRISMSSLSLFCHSINVSSLFLLFLKIISLCLSAPYFSFTDFPHSQSLITCNFFLLILLNYTFFSDPLLSFLLPFNHLPWSPCSEFTQDILFFSTFHVNVIHVCLSQGPHCCLGSLEL